MSLLLVGWGAFVVVLSSVIYYFYGGQSNLTIAVLGLRTRGNKKPWITPSTVSAERKRLLPAVSPALVYPPSRRGALLEVYDSLPRSHPLRQTSRAVILEPPRTGIEATISLGTTTDQLEGWETTPTGFSIDEIRKLGDFPDYATLSGVPLPEACANFDIEKALARPYRPFRWAYHQTMSLAKMEANWWLELTREYREFIALRLELYEKNGPLVLQYLSGSELACKELMEMILQFLCARYPVYFILHPPSTPGNTSSSHCLFENKVLSTKTVLDESQHPLLIILQNVPEDFAVMQRDAETGLYHLRAGVICSALGWSLGSKMGKKLHEVHEPVPDYEEKMRFSMDRYFSKLPTDQPIQRGSWGLEIDKPLFMPPGDSHEAYRESQLPEDALPISRINLRVDWQTLRRLPLSGAIVFNFKGLFTPIEHFRDEPYVPALCLRVLELGKENIMRYKSTWHVEHVAKPALRKWMREQEDNGIVEKDWKVQTLSETPFFPGWEALWSERQNV